MTESTLNDDTTTHSSQGSRIRRRLAYLAFSCALAAVLLFVVNTLGHNLFLYVNVGGYDAIIAASCGVLHTATTPHTDMTVDANTPYAIPEIQTDLLVMGPVHLFAEHRLDPMQPLRFDAFASDEYNGFELPMILLGLAYAALGYCLLQLARNRSLPLPEHGG